MNKSDMLVLANALEDPVEYHDAAIDKAADLIRQMAAQEPVAWIRYEWKRTGGKTLEWERPEKLSVREEAIGVEYEPLYAAPPPARKPLTDEQIEEVTVNMNRNLTGFRGWSLKEFARHIEAAHGIGASHD